MTKIFKEYYQDPKFKEKHKKYILEKIECLCGTKTARCNLSHHKKTKKHQIWCNNNEIQINDLNKLNEELKQILEKNKILIKKIKQL